MDRINRKKGKVKAVKTPVIPEQQIVNLTVNGEIYRFLVGKDINPSDTLSHTIRETLQLTGTKIGCDNGACGACTVIMDGKPVLSCLILTVECNGRNVTTIEGLGDTKTGKLDPIQQSFIDNTAFQCGFCTPGMIMGTKALLDENPSPSEHEIKDALSGHYCRCISHYHVLKAVNEVITKKMR